MTHLKREENISNFLLEQLQSAVPAASTVLYLKPLGGGSINRAYRISTDAGDYFVKLNSGQKYPGMFEAEVTGLQILRETKCIGVPEVVKVFRSENWAGLISEFIEAGKGTPESNSEFGTALACLHRNSRALFGLDHNNYIGSLVQKNEPAENWIDFFITQRIQPLWTLGREKKMLFREEDSLLNRVIANLPEIMPTEDPALLHGDLWSGNYMFNEKGSPVIFDPAVYYGHREVDLAMMKLFGGFDEEVFNDYNEAFPLYSGWRQRLDIYNIYPLLVHLHLFGMAYKGQLMEVLRKFA